MLRRMESAEHASLIRFKCYYIKDSDKTMMVAAFEGHRFLLSTTPRPGLIPRHRHQLGKSLRLLLRVGLELRAAGKAFGNLL